jgi:hypothetical protein
MGLPLARGTLNPASDSVASPTKSVSCSLGRQMSARRYPTLAALGSTLYRAALFEIASRGAAQ